MSIEARRAPTSGESASQESEESAEPSRRFRQLYEDNFDFVWRSVRMLGMAPDVADDVVQDVFLVAHRRLADFEARSSARTWLFAIALRVVRDRRRGQRRQLKLFERVLRLVREPPPTPFDSTLNARARAGLLNALAALPEAQRDVFVLAEVEEWSAPEIARALSVNLNTVYSRLRMARRAMAEHLREESP